MPKLRVLAGKDIIKFLGKHGFIVTRQHGSHIVLVRKNKDIRQVLTVANHKTVPRGTTKAIYNQAKQFIAEELLNQFFYTK